MNRWEPPSAPLMPPRALKNATFMDTAARRAGQPPQVQGQGRMLHRCPTKVILPPRASARTLPLRAQPS
jgi:hypothetical protein